MGRSIAVNRQLVIPFTPISLAPALWLKASLGTFQDAGSTIAEQADDPIGQWNSQAGDGNTASQSTGDNKPTLQSVTANGKTFFAVRFNGTTNFLSVDINFAVPALSLFFVVKLSSNAPYNTVLSKTTGNAERPFDHRANAFDSKFGFGPSLFETTAIGTTAFHIVGATHDGVNAARFYLDGALDGTGTASWGADTGSLLIGTRDDGVTRLAGDVPEIIAATRVIATQERQNLMSYFNSEYGIAVFS